MSDDLDVWRDEFMIGHSDRVKEFLESDEIKELWEEFEREDWEAFLKDRGVSR